VKGRDVAYLYRNGADLYSATAEGRGPFQKWLTRTSDERHRTIVHPSDTREHTGGLMAPGGDLIVSAAMREKILQAATIVNKPRGSVLFRRGDAVAGLYLIRSGRVSLAMDAVNRAFPPRILGAGSVVGLPATVAGSPYSLTAEVIEDAELAFVPRQAVVDCLKQNSQLCFEVMDILSSEITGTRSAMKGDSRPRKMS